MRVRGRYQSGIGAVDHTQAQSDTALVGIGLLGPLQIEGGATSLSPRDRAVLTALAVHPGEVMTTDRLADALWGEEPPASWSKVVHGCVMRLRRSLGRAAIDTAAGGYRLAVNRDDLDTQRFEAMVERGRELAATGAPERAASTLAGALSLWRGAPFEDLDGWAPGRSEAARLEELRRSTEEDLLDARLASGEHREVAAAGEARVGEEPLRERRWATLALAQYRCGRQADALRSIQRARHTLVDQLGIDPGPELVALEAAILRQDPDLAGQREPLAISQECPYQGLAPYDVADRDRFFGRDAEITACLERLSASPLLVVAGPSGCGKSSLVRAGLIPALRGRGQRVVAFVPGTDPDAALTNAIASAADTAVVVVDQLEELFTLDDNADTARAFCARLAAYATNQAPVVVAVRADHLAGLAADPAFARLAEQGLHLVSPLGGDALRAAIEGPAEQAGLRLEPGLVDLLVRDTEGEPGALPLLSYALAQTWERRDGRVLTVEGYRATGGIRGAVARSADRLYESLPPDQRSTLRSVLLRLVAPSPDGEPVRSRISRDTLGGDTARERVVGLLVRARLVTAEEDTIELAHEALARAWPRLRAWLDDDAAGQRIFHHLAAAAAGWESLGRPDSELYRGARLEAALEWRETAEPDLTALEAAFLDESVARAASEREALAQRSRHQARQNRRLRGLLTTTAVLLVVALVAGVVAVQRGRETGRQRDTAALEALVNQSLALRPTDRATSALLAVEAYRRAPDDARTHSALLGTFTAAPGFMGYRHLSANDFVFGAVVPGTSTAVVALDGRNLRLVDLDSGQSDDRFPRTETPLWRGRFESIGAAPARQPSLLRVSADGRFVVHMTTTALESFPSGGDVQFSPEPCFDPQAPQETDDRPCVSFSVYELASGRSVRGLITPSFGAGDVAINADGSLVAVAGGYDGELAVYRTADGELLGTLPGLPRPDDLPSDPWIKRSTAAVVFGPDGMIYLGSLQGPIRVVDPTSLQVVRTLEAPRLSSNLNLVATPDGLLVGNGRFAVVAVETSTGAIRWSEDIYDPVLWARACSSLAIAQVARRLYCANTLGQILERDLATGRPTGVSFDTQLGWIGDVATAFDGRELVAFGGAPVISRWRLDGGGPAVDHIAEGRTVVSGYDPTGRKLLVGGDPAVWDPVSDEAIDELDGGSRALWFGRDLVGGSFAGGSALYDVSAHAPVQSKSRQPPNGHDLLWMSPDGSRTYASVVEKDPEAGPSCEIWTYDPDRRRRIAPTIKLDAELDDDCSIDAHVSATRNGRRVVVTTGTSNYRSRRTTVYDGRTGKQVAGPLHGPIVTSVSPDGVLVAGDVSGGLTRYDLDTLERIGAFPGTQSLVTQLRFSDDGKILVASSLNQTLSIYDVATRARLGDPIGNDFPFRTGSIRPDGKAVATNAPDGVAVWDIDPEHLADAACKVAGRNLTTAEWDTYFGDPGGHRATCPNYD
jgi:DNA-binding SARP family transcriptional activator/WD40 repeat protein